MRPLLLFSLFVPLRYLLASGAASNEELDPLAGTFRIAGYLPDYRFGIDLNSTALLLDDLYIFSLSPQPQLGDMMFAVCCLDNSHYEKARQAASHALSQSGKEMKIWVTIGGGGRSTGFTKNPGAMIGAIKRLLSEENFHGVDFDCELFLSHQDYDDYETLISNAAYVLHKEGKYVSVAIHPGQTLSRDVYVAADRINLMTYDMPGSYHADFSKVRDAIDKLVQSGCPAHKIFLGLPAYARHRLRSGETKTFSELMDVELERGRTIDELRLTYEIDEFLFDSPAAVASKVSHAIKEGLGGVFFWEIGQDKQHESAPSGILLTAASKRLVEMASSTSKKAGTSHSTERTKEIYETVKEKEEL